MKIELVTTEQSGATKLLVVVLGVLLVGVLLFLRIIADNGPANNKDYDRVVQLVLEGKLKPSDNSGAVLLPSEYSYLSMHGSIGVSTSLDSAHTHLVLFTISVDSAYNRAKGYLYKENDVPPFTVDFPPLPYADSYACDRIKTRWFFCTYYFH